MDSLFLSPFKDEEVWDFHAVPQFHLGFFGFLALRAFQRESLKFAPLSVTGLSRSWKSNLAKMNLTEYPIQFLEFIPTLVDTKILADGNFTQGKGWEKRISLRFEKENKAVLIYIALGSVESGELGVSELMQDFLAFSQKDHLIDKAFIRKETSNYFYINGKEGTPRVFFRENPLDLPPFLLLIANLNKKSVTP